MHRRRVFILLTFLTICGASVLHASPADDQKQSSEHVAWVAEVLQRLDTVRPGMTRKTLLTVVTTEGGLSTGLQRTFVSRDCPFFKIDVEFRAVGRPDRDVNGRVTLVESDEDVVVKVSTPYLQFSHMD